MAVRRDGNQSGSRRKKPSRYQGIPSPAAAKKVGSQKKINRTTVKRSAPAPAPKPDVTLGGDVTPTRSGHKKSARRPAAPYSLLDTKKGKRFKSNRTASQRKLDKSVRALHALQARDKAEREGAPRLPIATISPKLSTNEAIKKALDIDTKKKERILKRGYEAETKRTGGIAPGLKHLSYLNRPSQAVGGILEGKRVDRAARDALLHGKGKTPSEALGINFGPAAAAVDIATDPTTYLSFGLAAPEVQAAKTAGKIAAKKAAKQAAKAGAKRNAAAEAAETAGRKAEQAALKARPPKGRRGITVGAFGKRTSGRATAKVARKIPKRDNEFARDLGSTFSPHVRPANVSDKEFRALKGAERESRSHVTRGRFHAVHTGRRMKDQIPRESYADVIDAIETNTVHKLSKELQGPAREIEKHLDDAIKAEKEAGIHVDARESYFSHHIDELMDQNGKGHGTRGMKFEPGFTKGRKHEGTVREIAERGGPKFSENIPLVVARRLSHSAEAVAEARLNRAVLEAGERVEPGSTFHVGRGQAVAKVEGKNLDFLSDEEAHALASGVAEDGAEYVVVNEGFVRGLRQRIVPGTLGDAGAKRFLKAFDKAQGTFKFAATYINPGFHARNYIGDSWNAYLGQGAMRLPINQARATRTLHRMGKMEEALLSGKAVKDTGKITVRTRYGQKMDISPNDLAKEAESVGAIRQGFLGRELPELLREETSVRRLGKAKSTGRAMRAGRLGKRTIQNREDLVRLASYIHARRQGLNPRESADFVMYHHFDYGDLSGMERGFMRRMFPFYTFTARNVPLQAKSLVKRPGRFAALEHVRRDTAEWLGISEEEFDNRLKEYQQRAQPFPVKLGGKVFALSAALPSNDIGMLPTSLDWEDFSKIPHEWQVKVLSMLSPIIKDPIEFQTNHSFFFNSDIQPENHPLVPAPGWAQHLPGFLKKAAGLRKGSDGKWMWNGRADYVSKVAPGPFAFFSNVTSPGTNRRGQGLAEKVGSYVGGVKIDPLDSQSAPIENLFKRRKALLEKRGALSQLGFSSTKKDTKESRRVREELARVEARIEKLSSQKGYHGKPITFGAPKKKGFFDTEDTSSKKGFFDDVKEDTSKKFFDDVR